MRSVGSPAKCGRDGDGAAERAGTGGVGDYDSCDAARRRIWEAAEYRIRSGSGVDFTRGGSAGGLVAPYCSTVDRRDLSWRRYSRHWRNGNRGRGAAEWLGGELFSGAEFFAHGGSAGVLARGGSELESFCGGEFYR